MQRLDDYCDTHSMKPNSVLQSVNSTMSDQNRSKWNLNEVAHVYMERISFFPEGVDIAESFSRNLAAGINPLWILRNYIATNLILSSGFAPDHDSPRVWNIWNTFNIPPRIWTYEIGAHIGPDTTPDLYTVQTVLKYEFWVEKMAIFEAYYCLAHSVELTWFKHVFS